MLCHTCTESNNQHGVCKHSQEVRALTGFWVTEEFNKALQIGYRVGEITAVWHFESWGSRVFIAVHPDIPEGKAG